MDMLIRNYISISPTPLSENKIGDLFPPEINFRSYRRLRHCVGNYAEHCRQGTFPSGLQEWWQPATGIALKLGIYNVSPDDGVVNIVIGKYNFTVFSLRSSDIFVGNEYTEQPPRCVAAIYLWQHSDLK
jgi:hypothetical protein